MLRRVYYSGSGYALALLSERGTYPPLGFSMCTRVSQWLFPLDLTGELHCLAAVRQRCAPSPDKLLALLGNEARISSSKRFLNVLYCLSMYCPSRQAALLRILQTGSVTEQLPRLSECQCIRAPGQLTSCAQPVAQAGGAGRRWWAHLHRNWQQGMQPAASRRSFPPHPGLLRVDAQQRCWQRR
jgi:hypothetical protein